jgi:Ca2+-dependent lipid-binding protein
MTLRIQVIDGQLLKSTDIGSKMENYVSVKLLDDPLGEREYRTKIVQGGVKTKKEENRIPFNDVLEIPVSSRNARLHVRIMDEDMTSDDVCAEGYVNLSNCGCFEPNRYRLLMHLVPKKGKQPEGGKGGDLTFTTQYV